VGSDGFGSIRRPDGRIHPPVSSKSEPLPFLLLLPLAGKQAEDEEGCVRESRRSEADADDVAGGGELVSQGGILDAQVEDEAIQHYPLRLSRTGREGESFKRGGDDHWRWHSGGTGMARCLLDCRRWRRLMAHGSVGGRTSPGDDPRHRIEIHDKASGRMKSIDAVEDFLGFAGFGLGGGQLGICLVVRA